MDQIVFYIKRVKVVIRKNILAREVVVAQLAEWLLPIPEDLGLNPVIGNFY